MALPFHSVLYFCDGCTTVNMLCVSSIYHAVNTSDVVKSFARRSDSIGVQKVPPEFIKLFFAHQVQLGACIQDAEGILLNWASKNGYVEVVKYLTSLGAYVRARTSSALCLASQMGHLDVVKYLVTIGAHVRTTSDRPLRLASARGHVHVVNYLISVGADVHAANDEAVRWASVNGHLETVKCLVSFGADPRGRAGEEDSLCLACRSGHLEVAKYLAGLHEANIADHDNAAVRWAFFNGHLKVVKYLAGLHVANIASSALEAAHWYDWPLRVLLLSFLVYSRR